MQSIKQKIRSIKERIANGFEETRIAAKNLLLINIGLFQHLDSDYYIKYAESKGAKIGSGTEFYGQKKLDLGPGPLIKIGNDCKITDDVRIVTHSGEKEILEKKISQ